MKELWTQCNIINAAVRLNKIREIFRPPGNPQVTAISFPRDEDRCSSSFSPDDYIIEAGEAENGTDTSRNRLVVFPALPAGQPPVHDRASPSRDVVAEFLAHPSGEPQVHDRTGPSRNVAVYPAHPSGQPPVHDVMVSSRKAAAVFSAQPVGQPPVYDRADPSRNVAVYPAHPSEQPPVHDIVGPSRNGTAVFYAQPATQPPIHDRVGPSRNAAAAFSAQPAGQPPIYDKAGQSRNATAVYSAHPSGQPPVHDIVASSTNAAAVFFAQPPTQPPVHDIMGSSRNATAMYSAHPSGQPPVHDIMGPSRSATAVFSAHPSGQPPVHDIMGSSRNGTAVFPAQPVTQAPVHDIVGSSTNAAAVFPAQTRPYVEIVEQPTPAVRFRYSIEDRGTLIRGVETTLEDKTCPSIRIHNHVGFALVIVSCVTADAPFRVHPHNLLLDTNANNGGIVEFNKTIKRINNMVMLKKLKIQCVNRHTVQNSLERREEVRVSELPTLKIDPFRHGFYHKTNHRNIDLNRVRLAIQVFVRQSVDAPWTALEPVVSDVISKAPAAPAGPPPRPQNQERPSRPSGVPDITCTSHTSGPVAGGTMMIVLLSEMVDRDDMDIIFYERDGAHTSVWIATGTIEAVYADNIALVVRTPPYTGPHLGLPLETVGVQFYLYKRSTQQCSRLLPFDYIFESRDAPPSQNPSGKRTRVARAAPNINEVGTPMKEIPHDSDKALIDSLAQLSVKIEIIKDSNN